MEFEGKQGDRQQIDAECVTCCGTMEMLQRDVQFLASEMLKQRWATCMEEVKCSSSRGKDCTGRKSWKRRFAEFEGGQCKGCHNAKCGTYEKTVEKEIEKLRRQVRFLASEMLKQRCAICMEDVNCSRRDTGCTGRNRTFTEFEGGQCKGGRCDHHPPAEDVDSGACSNIMDREVEMLRRNVQLLAGCYPPAQPTIAQEDPFVRFVINGTDQITAHRSVLAGVSPVFEKMFSVDMLEKETGRISISDASLPTMKAVVQYCYTADVTFAAHMDLDEVTYIAHKYEINSLKERCEIELCDRFRNSMKITVDLKEALGMTERALTIAEKYVLESLRRTCVKELRLRNYMVSRKCEMERMENLCGQKRHPKSCVVDDRTSPRTLAKLMRLSFNFGTEDMQDGIYRAVQNLSDEEAKQVWTEVIKASCS